MPDREAAAKSPNHDVRTRIVDAAERLFAEKGFDATSISDICEAADVGRALIYYYFKDKRDLYDSILRDAGERIMSAANEAAELEGTAQDRLRHFVEAFLQIHGEHPNVPRMAIRAEMEGNMAPGTGPKQHFDHVTRTLGKVVEDGVAQGEFRDVPARRAVHMLMGITHSLIMMQLHENARPSLDEDVEFAMSVFTRGIRNSP